MAGINVPTGLEEGEEQDQMIVPPDDDMLPAMPPSPLRAPSSHRSEPSQASLGDIEFASNGGVDLPEASAGGLDDLLGALPTPDPTPSDTQRCPHRQCFNVHKHAMICSRQAICPDVHDRVAPVCWRNQCWNLPVPHGQERQHRQPGKAVAVEACRGAQPRSV